MITCPQCGNKLEPPPGGSARFLICACGNRVAVPESPTASSRSSPRTMPRVPSYLIQGYKLLRSIGTGGMGTVYQAVQESLQRMVAVKILPAQLASDAHFVRRFEREADALAQLRHPNIVSIIDKGHVGTTYYFVMEYIEGPDGKSSSLRSFIDRRSLGPSETQKFACQVADALAHAHSKNIIHRDIKPSNILIDERGDARVVDFGIAHLALSDADTTSQLTLSGTIIGTPQYMAPEQKTDASRVDARSDIFSVGIVLYEMLTGALPIGIFELPSELGLDTRWDSIIQRTIHKSPERRFQTMKDLLSELEQIRSAPQPPPAHETGPKLDAEPAVATPTTSVTSVASPCKNCNRPNPLENRFCLHCGASLVETCPTCQAENRIGSRFCGKCGGNVQDLLKKKQLENDLNSALERAAADTLNFQERRSILLQALQIANSLNDLLPEPEKETQTRRVTSLLDQLWQTRLQEVSNTGSSALQLALLIQKGEDLPPDAALASRIYALKMERSSFLMDLQTLMQKGLVGQLLDKAAKSPWSEDAEVTTLCRQAREKVEQITLLVHGKIPDLRQYKRYFELRRVLDELSTFGIPLKGFDQLQEKTNSTIAEAENHYQEALTLKEKRKLDEAKALLEKALDVVSDHPLAPQAIQDLTTTTDRLRKVLGETENHFKAGQLSTVSHLTSEILREWDLPAARKLQRNAELEQFELFKQQRRKMILAFVAAGGILLFAFSAFLLHFQEESNRRMALEEALQSGDFLSADKLVKTDPERTALEEAKLRPKKFQDAIARRDLQTADRLASSQPERETVGKLRNALIQEYLDAKDFASAEKIAVSSSQKERVSDARKESGSTGTAETTPPSKPLGAPLYTAWPFDPGEAQRRQKETSQALGAADEIVESLDPDIKMTFALIPPGEFVMGSPEDEDDREATEGPTRLVCISKPFYMGKYEVTQAQWKTMMGYNPSHFKGDDNPVEKVSWLDAQEFIRKVNEKLLKPMGREFSLPTEAQWEYACRAGSPAPMYYGDDPGYKQLADYAWFNSNSGESAHPVGQRKPNAWALYDMHGNVWEWCQDWYAPYTAGDLRDPGGPLQGTQRVDRGGSWPRDGSSCRSATRAGRSPLLKGSSFGFRICRGL